MWVEFWGELPGRLVVVSGPSGSGKSSVIKKVLEDPSLNFSLSVSATSRKPRPGEVEGVDYFFKTHAEFREAIHRGEFLEWAEYNENYYGTPDAAVFNTLKHGMSVLLEIEVDGAKQIRDRAPAALFVFLKTPRFQDLVERLYARGTETDAQIFRRLRKARVELAEAHWYDATLVNDDFNACVEALTQLLKTQRLGGSSNHA